MVEHPPRFRSFSAVKAGNTDQENEDRFSTWSGCLAGSWDIARVALSDGATESAFAREWATILVCDEWDKQLSASATEPLQALPEARVERWLDRARSAFDAETGERTLPWYGRAKARQGAAASFLGLRVARVGHTWMAVACGDTCLFHVGAAGGIVAFPLDSPGAFNNRPMLVPSKRGARLPAVHAMRGRWRQGDRFILATDALAVWLLGDCAQHTRLQALLACDEQQYFAALVEQERRAGRLKNDDTTALIYCP